MRESEHGCFRKCQKSVPSGHRAEGTGGAGRAGPARPEVRQRLGPRALAAVVRRLGFVPRAMGATDRI